MLVAIREFKATVLTKGFLIGSIILPLAMTGFMLVLLPVISSIRPPPVKGTVALIDRTGLVGPTLRHAISPEEIKHRMDQRAARQAAVANRMATGIVRDAKDREAIGTAAKLAGAAESPPTLTLEELPAGADPAQEKAALRDTKNGARLALIVIDPNAVTPDTEGKLGGYSPYVNSRLDERVQDLIFRAVRESIVNARWAAVSYDPTKIRSLMEVDEAMAVSVTQTGERNSVSGARYIVPVAFILLLMISSITGGNYLLTSTVEEKSNRVMEVLLSAISPMEIMVGKIIGQMAVGLLILMTYTGLGVTALITFALLDVLSWMHLVYLLVFFVLAFFMIASLFAAVGSAVSEVHEAQSLIGPVMMVLVAPWLLMPAIVGNPSSTLSVVLSLTPPIAPFVMVQRIAASSEPVPVWQIAGAIAVAAWTAVFAAWAASKIFRIGVLMYGKPPNLPTLLRWVRQA
jgi:ABC-2 type transport system permease protein